MTKFYFPYCTQRLPFVIAPISLNFEGLIMGSGESEFNTRLGEIKI